MLMVMEFIEIEAFVAIARAGSFTSAASVLHLSQPGVSRRIELLERELGAPLFDRTREGARLTEAGANFLPFAEQMLAAARDGAAAVRTLTQGDEGTVSLALVGTLANSDLLVRLQTFRTAYPAIRIALRTARSEEVSELVRRGEHTLGLRYFADRSSAIVSIPVHDELLILVCARNSRLVCPDAHDAAALKGVPWVGFPVGSGSSSEGFARLLERQLIKCGLEGAEIIAVDSLTAQKRLIEADFGVGLLPATSVEEELRLGTLQRMSIAALHTTASVHAIHRRAGFLSLAAQRLLDALTAGSEAAA